jgi:hypothetical protein
MDRKLLVRCSTILTIGSLLALGYTTQADAVLLFDRGLPETNLNNISGSQRSNVVWATNAQNPGFFGDNFTIGNVGETYKIDNVRTWVVAGSSLNNSSNLGNWFESITLLTGNATDSNISSLISTNLETDGTLSNSNISLTKVTYPDINSSSYDNFGNFFSIWQVDFTNLNWTVVGGIEYNFGVQGIGRQIPNSSNFYSWFNHASNADLSGSSQDGADNQIIQFDTSGNLVSYLNTQGNGWDKSSDINIKIFGDISNNNSVPEPSSIFSLLTLGIVGLSLALKKNSLI